MYLVLKDFNGSQTGLDFTQFKKDEVVSLSDDLAKAALAEGWVKMAATGGAVSIEPVLVGEKPSFAEVRETKVVQPAETKPAKPLDKMSKAELVSHALTVHGLKLVPDDMTVKQMIAAIEKAA